MKKSICLVAAIVLILTVCIVPTATKAEAKGPAKEIIGSWVRVGNSSIIEYYMYQFREDGTGTYCYDDADIDYAVKEFTYSYTGGNTITINGVDVYISLVGDGLVIDNPFSEYADEVIFTRA